MRSKSYRVVNRSIRFHESQQISPTFVAKPECNRLLDREEVTARSGQLSIKFASCSFSLWGSTCSTTIHRVAEQADGPTSPSERRSTAGAYSGLVSGLSGRLWVAACVAAVAPSGRADPLLSHRLRRRIHIVVMGLLAQVLEPCLKLCCQFRIFRISV